MKKTIPLEIKNLVRTEYLAGHGSCNQIALQFGLAPKTVSNWAFREKWADQTQKLEAISTSSAMESRESQQQAHLARITKLVNKPLDTLAGMNPKSLVDVDRFASGLEKLDRIGRRALGLDDESQKPSIINIGLLSDFSPVFSQSDVEI